MRTTLPSFAGFSPRSGASYRLLDRRQLRRVERLGDDERRLRNRQAGDLIERHFRTVGLDVHAIQDRDGRTAGADAGKLVLDVLE